MTHAEEIVRAVAVLTEHRGQRTFTRRQVRDQAGVCPEKWNSSYNPTFQGMREDDPGGAPRPAARLQGVFRRVGYGVYELTDRGQAVVDALVRRCGGAHQPAAGRPTRLPPAVRVGRGAPCPPARGTGCGVRAPIRFDAGGAGLHPGHFAYRAPQGRGAVRGVSDEADGVERIRPTGRYRPPELLSVPWRRSDRCLGAKDYHLSKWQQLHI